MVEFVDTRPELVVTELGSKQILNGAYRPVGFIIRTTPDNALFYQEQGWATPQKVAATKAKSNAPKVHHARSA